jgi:hypothetical protein
MGGALLLVACFTGFSSAEEKESVPLGPPEAPAVPTEGIQQVGCSSCGGVLLGEGPGYVEEFGPEGCGGCFCKPGRKLKNCAGCCTDSKFGQFLSGIYECCCCPDPCYEPRWIAAANNAFFIPSPRPVTHTRIIYDAAFGLENPDRAEFWSARIGGGGKGPGFIARDIDYQQLSLYTEVGTEKFGFFTELPYRFVEPSDGAILGVPEPFSGFADLTLGTKSVLMDCELLLLTLQFKTFLPTGSPGHFMSTGHVSLEPSLLFALKLTPDAYLQGQFAYWIPISGDDLYQGNVFHFHTAANYVFWRPTGGIQLVSSMEFHLWSILNGQTTVTDFLAGGEAARVPAEDTVISIGPGIRLVLCDKFDVGLGSAFAITNAHYEDQILQFELRWRF